MAVGDNKPQKMSVMEEGANLHQAVFFSFILRKWEHNDVIQF